SRRTFWLRAWSNQCCEPDRVLVRRDSGCDHCGVCLVMDSTVAGDRFAALVGVAVSAGIAIPELPHGVVLAATSLAGVVVGLVVTLASLQRSGQEHVTTVA